MFNRRLYNLRIISKDEVFVRTQINFVLINLLLFDPLTIIWRLLPVIILVHRTSTGSCYTIVFHLIGNYRNANVITLIGLTTGLNIIWNQYINKKHLVVRKIESIQIKELLLMRN